MKIDDEDLSIVLHGLFFIQMELKKRQQVDIALRLEEIRKTLLMSLDTSD